MERSSTAIHSATTAQHSSDDTNHTNSQHQSPPDEDMMGSFFNMIFCRENQNTQQVKPMSVAHDISNSVKKTQEQSKLSQLLASDSVTGYKNDTGEDKQDLTELQQSQSKIADSGVVSSETSSHKPRQVLPQDIFVLLLRQEYTSLQQERRFLLSSIDRLASEINSIRKTLRDSEERQASEATSCRRRPIRSLLRASFGGSNADVQSRMSLEYRVGMAIIKKQETERRLSFVVERMMVVQHDLSTIKKKKNFNMKDVKNKRRSF